MGPGACQGSACSPGPGNLGGWGLSFRGSVSGLRCFGPGSPPWVSITSGVPSSRTLCFRGRIWESGPRGSRAPRVLGAQGEGLGAGAPYQELQPPQQPVQPGLQGPQLGLQGPQGRAARPAQPLHVPQVGEQVGPQPRQHAGELGDRPGVGGQERPPRVPGTPHLFPLPAPTCRAPSAPALMAKVGRESRLWSPSAGNLSLCGGRGEAMRGALPSSGGPLAPHHGPQTPPPLSAPLEAPVASPPVPVSPTSCAASCRVSASSARVSRMALSSSARGSGEARGGPGGGPGAAARSGHRLSAARTRQQTPAGGRGRGAQARGVVAGRRTEGLGWVGRAPRGAGRGAGRRRRGLPAPSPALAAPPVGADAAPGGETGRASPVRPRTPESGPRGGA